MNRSSDSIAIEHAWNTWAYMLFVPVASTAAPASTSILQRSRWPLRADLCRGVCSLQMRGQR